VNTGTWCVPIVPGCMMPSAAAAGTGAIGYGTELYSTTTNGGATYNPIATVHVRSMCTVERLGCTDDAGAENYDPTATTLVKCYNKLPGCLNPYALNYMCAERGTAPCDVRATGVSRHAKHICSWEGDEGAPSPPPPGMPGGGGYSVKERHYIVVSMYSSELYSDIGREPVMKASHSKFTGHAGLPASTTGHKVFTMAEVHYSTLTPDLVHNYESGSSADSSARRQLVESIESVTDLASSLLKRASRMISRAARRLNAQDGAKLHFETEYESEDEANEAHAKLVAEVDLSKEALTAALGVEVTSDATTHVETRIEYVQDGLPDAVVTAIIAGVVAGIVVIGIIVAYVVYKRRTKVKAVVPA